jgi:hypothetical protein
MNKSRKDSSKSKSAPRPRGSTVSHPAITGKASTVHARVGQVSARASGKMLKAETVKNRQVQAVGKKRESKEKEAKTLGISVDELQEINRVAGEIIHTLDRINRIDREIIDDLRETRRIVAEAAVIHENR